MLDDLHREVEEWIDAGDWVISVGRWKGRGKGQRGGGSRATARTLVASETGSSWEWIGNFPTKEAALEAVGLSE